MWKRIALWLLLVAVSTAGIFAVDTVWTRRALAKKTVRLHVVANSDSDEDQAQKLRVRDAILLETKELTADCANAEQARAAISDGLVHLQAAAETVLRAEDCKRTVRVTLEEETFETRRYDTFTLPAGNYTALRVVIGDGAGHNWWCVVFPSLCTAATGDELESLAAAGGFDDDETALMTGGEEQYVLRFKLLEWLGRLSSFLASK